MANKWILIGIGLILLLNTSCSKYYYSSIQSVQRDVFRNEMGDFVQEDDTATIIYNFFGHDLPIQITIHNKTDEPLFVDWNQSALIVEDEANNYVKGNIRIKGGLTGRTYTYKDYFSPGMEHGNINYSSESSSFVPPQSRITHTPIILANFSFEDIPDSVFTKQPFYTNKMEKRKVKVVEFKEYDSPVRFRSYLTLYTVNTKGERTKSMNYQQRFYLSKVIKAGGMAPENLQDYVNQRGDFFFVRYEKGKNAGLITGLVAIGVAGIVLEATTGGYYY